MSVLTLHFTLIQALAAVCFSYKGSLGGRLLISGPAFFPILFIAMLQLSQSLYQYLKSFPSGFRSQYGLYIIPLYQYYIHVRLPFELDNGTKAWMSQSYTFEEFIRMGNISGIRSLKNLNTCCLLSGYLQGKAAVNIALSKPKLSLDFRLRDNRTTAYNLAYAFHDPMDELLLAPQDFASYLGRNYCKLENAFKTGLKGP